jgi:MFS family permease
LGINDYWKRTLAVMAEKAYPSATKQSSLINKLPFFYGWVIMAAGTFGLIMTSPGQTYAVSIFIENIIEDLGISRSLVSTLYSIGTLIGSFSLPFWGRMVDQKGTRKMVVLISILFGLACIYMGLVKNAFMLGIGFILVRMLGQGSLGLISQTAINQWWVRKRGMVIGISGLLTALLGMGIFPNLVYALISAFEWRIAYAILGLVLLLVMAPVGFFLFRNRPEDYHLLPDGDMDVPSTAITKSAEPDPIEENWTLKEAIRTRTFWMLAISLALFSMLSTGLFFHLVSIFENRSLNPSVAASVFLPVAFAAALTQFTAGFLTDRISLRYLLAVGLLLQATALLSAQVLQGTVTAFLFGIVLGATNGISRATGAVAWPKFFGRKHLGSIYGFTTAVAIIGAALGPLPFGIAYDILGTYQPVLLISAGVCILFSIASLTIQKPKRKFVSVK